MPKLAAKDRKKVESSNAIGGDFEPMPPGRYLADLKDVEARQSNAGNPVWSVTFENIRDLDGNKQPGRQWYNLNLPTTDKAPDDYKKDQATWEKYQGLCAGRIKAFFEAFGYTPDSDTDEMIGETVQIQVGIRTINQGAKAGQQANEVNGVYPLPEGTDAAAFSGGGKDDDDF